MPCPLCGDICRCSSDAHPAAAPRWLTDAPQPTAATPPVALETPAAEAPNRHPVEGSLSKSDESFNVDDSDEPAPEDSNLWRQEVAARLNRYQARRKPRPPRYPSLRLRFDQEDPARAASGSSAESQIFQQRIATASNQALALDGFADITAPAVETPPAMSAASRTHAPEGAAAFPQTAESHQPTASTTTAAQVAVQATAQASAKIIEFPRSWTPPPPPLDELAEPVLDRDRPRILEAPEIVPPPPALGGITIEPAPQPDLEKRPGIDIPLQSAPLGRRIFGAVIDGVIIAAACALFVYIFWRMTPTAIRPPQFQMIAAAAALSAIFWGAYQYLLVVYSGTTPGLVLARLELARFDGSRAPRRLRRWRVLASYLSAVSLGMGYAWVFLDEDALCWHDRITHTYLAPRIKSQRA
jgi:RDD family